MKDKTISIILILFFIGLSFYIFTLYMGEKRKTKDSDKAAAQIADGYKFELSKKDSAIAFQEQVIIYKDSRLARLGDTLKVIKNQKAQVRIVTKTIVQKDSIFIDRLTITDSGVYIKLPYSLSKTSKWYGYTFSLTEQNYAVMDSLWFLNDIVIAWGVEDHDGWLKNLIKKNKPIVYFKDQNPYSTTRQFQNVVYEDYKKKKLNIGFQVGYGMTNKGLSPYAGIGIGINIF